MDNQRPGSDGGGAVKREGGSPGTTACHLTFLSATGAWNAAPVAADIETVKINREGIGSCFNIYVSKISLLEADS